MWPNQCWEQCKNKQKQTIIGDPYELPAADVGRGEVRGERVGGLGGVPATDAGCQRVRQHTDPAHDTTTRGHIPGTVAVFFLLCFFFISL